MPKRNAAAPAPKPPPETRPVNERGMTWQAQKLTGKRAQRGNLPGGAPRWTYEVQDVLVEQAARPVLGMPVEQRVWQRVDDDDDVLDEPEGWRRRRRGLA